MSSKRARMQRCSADSESVSGIDLESIVQVVIENGGFESPHESSPQKPRKSPRFSKSSSEKQINSEPSMNDAVQMLENSIEAKDDNKESPKEEIAVKTGCGSSKKSKLKADTDPHFIGLPIDMVEAKQRWPERYDRKRRSNTENGDDNEETAIYARRHYRQATLDGFVYNLEDDVYIKAEDGNPDFVGRIVEFFEDICGKPYFTSQWFYKARDTVIKDVGAHDPRRVFISKLKDVNPLDCIVSKTKIVQVTPDVDLKAKEKKIPHCTFYYDMSYSVPYLTFSSLPPDNSKSGSDSSTISSENVIDAINGEMKSDSEDFCPPCGKKSSLTCLDLYAGCGGMSTGLCLGANLAGVNLVTKWAVDINSYACESLKLNHPETEVRNEAADNFLALLKEWEKLCERFSVIGTRKFEEDALDATEEEDAHESTKVPPGEYEVAKFVGICYGDYPDGNKQGLKFKVRWKGFGPSDDTWEPVDGLGKCQERIQEFVCRSYKSGILPLPGDVDVICGGPPCQGISGFNRFRNRDAPLEGPKNKQMLVYMDLVDYLKPRYVLMENVVDLLKFSNGYLGRYALSRLVQMNYQARMGMMAAGCYGLPQFRMRVFFWGARPTEKLPQFPLPTHDVVVRGYIPQEFEQSTVAYDENQTPKLEKALLLGDAISDLPLVTNYEKCDEMEYGRPAKTSFQHSIRARKEEHVSSSGSNKKSTTKALLFDHQPLQLNEDDYQRVCRIPKRKGANFRDLPGVLVGEDNVVQWDLTVERELLPSGKPLVPDYAMSFTRGKSSKPFGRLWWDETVPTVVTRAEPHNQAIVHPEQDRVLTIRENARLQGFPDYYKLVGPIKERYIQVGNAVAVPVAKALGYALGLAIQGLSSDEPVMVLPEKFPDCLQRVSSEVDMLDLL